ncbi:MAG: diguanylate cyclase [Firmicutes bacterium]|nr:diguanylate cyclase [Bacillota bacterium]
MFSNMFHIDIIAKNNYIRNTAADLDDMEDSGFVFNTFDDVSTVVPRNLDNVLIVDGNSVPADMDISSITAYKVLVCDKYILSTCSDAVLSAFDDLWLTPEDEPYSEKFLLYKLRRLLYLMKEKADNRKMQICFDTTIDSIPDLIWYKDTIGAHLKVNDGFCKAVQKTKQQIYKKGHYYIWDIPKEEYDQGDYVCLESEDIVMKARRTVLFDEKVKTKSGMRLFKTYKSPLIDSDDTIFGTCGVAHDVTDLQNINTELTVLLESMPFAIYVEDNNDNIISVNSKFRECFSIDEVFGNPNWKKDLLASGINHDDGSVELTVYINGEEHIFIYHEESIIDIFAETIGKLQIFRDITIQRNLEKQTLLSANTDFLTGLNNRRSLFVHFDDIKDFPLIALVYIDLDNFKKVNDIYGHDSGDIALKITSSVMNECFPLDFTARLGGDEFLVVISRDFTKDEIISHADKLINTLISSYSEYDEFSMLSVSIGIAFSDYSQDKDKKNRIADLLKYGDSALYAAKNSGKGKYCIYTE